MEGRPRSRHWAAPFSPSKTQILRWIRPRAPVSSEPYWSVTHAGGGAAAIKIMR
jgi:hypothetical protein